MLSPLPACSAKRCVRTMSIVDTLTSTLLTGRWHSGLLAMSVNGYGACTSQPRVQHPQLSDTGYPPHRTLRLRSPKTLVLTHEVPAYHRQVPPSSCPHCLFFFGPFGAVGLHLHGNITPLRCRLMKCEREKKNDFMQEEKVHEESSDISHIREATGMC